jgi:hypothetical protein
MDYIHGFGVHGILLALQGGTAIKAARNQEDSSVYIQW